jgi:hypothetical protein
MPVEVVVPLAVAEPGLDVVVVEVAGEVGVVLEVTPVVEVIEAPFVVPVVERLPLAVDMVFTPPLCPAVIVPMTEAQGEGGNGIVEVPECEGTVTPITLLQANTPLSLRISWASTGKRLEFSLSKACGETLDAQRL